MIKSTTNTLKQFWSAGVFSPHGLVLRAGLVVLFFAVCELGGMRDHTTFLSGTPTEAGGGGSTPVVLGIIYLAAYLAFVLLAPVLLLAAAMLALLQRWIPRVEEKTESSSRTHES
jgi:hypothetical protein